MPSPDITLQKDEVYKLALVDEYFREPPARRASGDLKPVILYLVHEASASLSKAAKLSVRRRQKAEEWSRSRNYTFSSIVEAVKAFARRPSESVAEALRFAESTSPPFAGRRSTTPKGFRSLSPISFGADCLSPSTPLSPRTPSFSSGLPQLAFIGKNEESTPRGLARESPSKQQDLVSFLGEFEMRASTLQDVDEVFNLFHRLKQLLPNADHSENDEKQDDKAFIAPQSVIGLFVRQSIAKFDVIEFEDICDLCDAVARELSPQDSFKPSELEDGSVEGTEGKTYDSARDADRRMESLLFGFSRHKSRKGEQAERALALSKALADFGEEENSRAALMEAIHIAQIHYGEQALALCLLELEKSISSSLDGETQSRLIEDCIHKALRAKEPRLFADAVYDKTQALLEIERPVQSLASKDKDSREVAPLVLQLAMESLESGQSEEDGKQDLDVNTPYLECLNYMVQAQQWMRKGNVRLASRNFKCMIELATKSEEHEYALFGELALLRLFFDGGLSSSFSIASSSRDHSSKKPEPQYRFPKGRRLDITIRRVSDILKRFREKCTVARYWVSLFTAEILRDAAVLRGDYEGAVHYGKAAVSLARSISTRQGRRRLEAKARVALYSAMVLQTASPERESGVVRLQGILKEFSAGSEEVVSAALALAEAYLMDDRPSAALALVTGLASIPSSKPAANAIIRIAAEAHMRLGDAPTCLTLLSAILGMGKQCSVYGYAKGDCLLLRAKARWEQCQQVGGKDLEGVLRNNILPDLFAAIACFEEVSAFNKLKDALYLQALVYDKIHDKEGRETAASRCLKFAGTSIRKPTVSVAEVLGLSMTSISQRRSKIR